MHPFHVAKYGAMVRVPLQQWMSGVYTCGGGAVSRFLHTSASLEAARKGTRAKADAKKRAHKKKVVEVVKKEYVPLQKRLEMQQTGGLSPRRVEDDKKEPIDDVWITRYFKWKVYPVQTALEMHRETHHPTMIGLPHALVTAHFQIDMTAEKKNRFLDNFSSVVRLPHDFDADQAKTILVVSRKDEVLEAARQMNITHAAGLDIVKQVQNGEVSLQDYEYILAETEILPELIPIRGLMKKRFPSVKTGTAGSDLLPIVERFVKGVRYECKKDKFHHDFAAIAVPFGKLSQSNDELEENLGALLRDVNKQKLPRTKHDFITLVSLHSHPSPEYFKIDPTLYLEEARQEEKRVSAAV